MLGRQPKVILPNGATVKQQPRLLGLLSVCVVEAFGFSGLPGMINFSPHSQSPDLRAA